MCCCTFALSPVTFLTAWWTLTPTFTFEGDNDVIIIIMCLFADHGTCMMSGTCQFWLIVGRSGPVEFTCFLVRELQWNRWAVIETTNITLCPCFLFPIIHWSVGKITTLFPSCLWLGWGWSAEPANNALSHQHLIPVWQWCIRPYVDGTIFQSGHPRLWEGTDNPSNGIVQVN